MSEDDKLKKLREELERQKLYRAEEYAFCPIHSRRFPIGASCPSCAQDRKKST
jgi:hypothetical protein